MNKMVITRGLPGSGKSTAAKKLYDGFHTPLRAICSTDDFRCHTDGKYKYDGKQNRYMHGKNQDLVLSLARLNYDLIIVDNTHTTWREIRPYALIALLYGYEIDFLYSNTEWAFDVDECTKRNTHCVPRDTIQMMKDRFEYHAVIMSKLLHLKEAYDNTRDADFMV